MAWCPAGLVWGSPAFYKHCESLLDGIEPNGPSTQHVDWPEDFVLVDGRTVGRHTWVARRAEDAAVAAAAERKRRYKGSKPDEEQWDAWLAELEHYRAAHGDALVPWQRGKGAACALPACGGVNHKQLGEWVSTQRALKKVNNSRMTPERVAQLEAVDSWMWDPFEHAW